MKALKIITLTVITKSMLQAKKNSFSFDVARILFFIIPNQI
jgi:hypothetical protein